MLMVWPYRWRVAGAGAPCLYPHFSCIDSLLIFVLLGFLLTASASQNSAVGFNAVLFTEGLVFCNLQTWIYDSVAYRISKQQPHGTHLIIKIVSRIGIGKPENQRYHDFLSHVSTRYKLLKSIFLYSRNCRQQVPKLFQSICMCQLLHHLQACTANSNLCVSSNALPHWHIPYSIRTSAQLSRLVEQQRNECSETVQKRFQFSGDVGGLADLEAQKHLRFFMRLLPAISLLCKV